MGRRITIIEKQNLYDIALQETGDILAVFDIAAENGLSVTSEMSPGDELIIPEGVDGNREILAYYTMNGIRPATGAIEDAEILEGIDYWYIDIDFIIS